MDAQHFARLKSLMGVEAKDLEALRQLTPHLMSALPEVLDRFYEHMQSQPWVHEIIKDSRTWRRHRDSIRGWVVTVLTQEDSELEDLTIRTGQGHVSLGIHAADVIGAAGYLWATLNAALASNPGWSSHLRDVFNRRWTYAIALVIGAYEDHLKDVISRRTTELERVLDDLTNRTREVQGLNRLLQKMMSDLSLPEPDKRDLEGVGARIQELLTEREKGPDTGG